MESMKAKLTGKAVRRTVSFVLVLLALLGLMSPTIIGTSPLDVEARAAETVYTYYPKYTGRSVSIVDGLIAIGEDFSFSNRTKIALLNGITDYSGTASQNTQLLNLLKAGQLIQSSIEIPSPDSSTGSPTPPTDPSESSPASPTDPSTDPSDDPPTDPSDDPSTDPSDDPSADPSDDPSIDTFTDPSTGLTYAVYKGVDYTHLTVNPARIRALDKARQMVTLQWTAPCNFPTWTSNTGECRLAVANDGTSDIMYIEGKTYTGVPYSMKNHSYDDIAWMNLLSKGITTTSMTGWYYSYVRPGTAKGIDCSYFVYVALSSANTGYRLTYQNTPSMLYSSYYTKIGVDQMKPGDLFLKNGHVMMFVGKSGDDQYAVFEAAATPSKCTYSTYTLEELKNYSAYKFKGFMD